MEDFDEWAQARSRRYRRIAKDKKWDDGDQGRRGDSRHVSGLRRDRAACTNFWRRPTLAKGDKAKAMAELAALLQDRRARSGDAEAARRRCRPKQGTKKEAAATLERLNLIYLEDEEAHQQLGDLYMDLGQSQRSRLREYQAVLALKPVDHGRRALRLAQALTWQPTQHDDARDEVLSALEAAPGFKPAQKLVAGTESARQPET